MREVFVAILLLDALLIVNIVELHYEMSHNVEIIRRRTCMSPEFDTRAEIQTLYL
jgi:hypothetical protein